jgi:hypothetical protein
LDAAEERGIRQPAIPETATAKATDGKHWVAGGVASGGRNGILLWRITATGTGPVDAVYKAIDQIMGVSVILETYSINSVNEGIEARSRHWEARGSSSNRR